MSKRRALVIGVSEYGDGLEPLPGSLLDIHTIAAVLQDPACGAFEVQALENCDRASLETGIEQFFRGGDKDDVLLFYFSGHGDLGSGGMLNQQLHLCTRDTHKQDKRLVESSAMSAGFLKRQMDLSKSQRIAVILDCCYSGAIADFIKKGEGEIDLSELKAQGRVILASSSAAKVALQAVDGLSLYTRYLIEGMKGAAYPGQGEWIVARDLHAYADRRFAIESKGGYAPKIIAEDTGFNLPIVRAPKPDPLLTYRQQVDRIFQELDQELGLAFTGQIEDELDRGSLETCRERYRISLEDANRIELEVQKPYLVRATQRRTYAAYFQKALQNGEIGNRQRRRLTEIRQNLLLGEADAQRIEQELTAQLPLPVKAAPPPAPLPDPAPTPDPPPAPPKQPTQPTAQNPRYQQLEEYLKNGQWREADKETYRLMITEVGKKEGQWFDRDDLLEFPCEPLRAIDGLWVKYSSGRFGFSIQKHIYLSKEIGGIADGQYHEEAWTKFCHAVGWQEDGSYASYDRLIFNTSAPRGHLPLSEEISVRFSSLASRLVKCNL
ncbi:GUN4 domain-containing protein [Trichothermofontia sp.]